MMAVQVGAKPEMMNTSDDEDDMPLVFKRSASSKENQLNPEVKKSSSQKHDGKSGRQMSDVHSPNGQSSAVQKGKTVLSTKGSPVKSPLATPKTSSSSAKPSIVKSPVENTKVLTSAADQSKINSQQTKTTIVKVEKSLGKPDYEPRSDSEDSEDGKPLSFRLSAGASKGSSNVSKGPSSSGHVSSALPKPRVKEEDSEDEKPLSMKFQLKRNVRTSTSNSYDSGENKPLASKLKLNGSGIRDNQVSKSSTALNKRPLAEAKSSGQSSVKKAKLSDALASSNRKHIYVKVELKAKDEVDDHVPISHRIKKLATPVSKLSDKKKTTVSSSVNKINKKSKNVMKKTKFSKSSKVPPCSGEGQKWTTLAHNGVIFPPPYKPHGVKMLYKGQPVDLTPEQEEVATMIAVMLDTDYYKKPKFIENFMSDWKKILGKNHIIQNFNDCNFKPIYEWHQREKEKKKQMSTEEKKTLKEEKMKQEEKYMWALVDGVKEKVGNFRVEPPGLFRGRGEHPKMGKLKKRIRPSDITINIGRDAPVPECPIPGERMMMRLIQLVVVH